MKIQIKDILPITDLQTNAWFSYAYSSMTNFLSEETNMSPMRNPTSILYHYRHQWISFIFSHEHLIQSISLQKSWLIPKYKFRSFRVTSNC